MNGVAGLYRPRLAAVVLLISLALVGATPALLRQHPHVAGSHPAKHPAPRPHALLAHETIVAVGDSITKGDWDTTIAGGWVTRLGKKLRRAYPHVSVVVRNEGVDGDTTAGVLARLSRDVLRFHPDMVVISIGTNDFDRDVAPSSFSLELHLLVGRLRAAVEPPVVVLASMLPIAAQTPARLADQRAFNDIIRRTAADMKVGYLDLFDPWLALGPDYLHTLRHDTEHPNSIGYELLASITAAFLEGGYLDLHGQISEPAVAPTCSALVCGS